MLRRRIKEKIRGAGPLYVVLNNHGRWLRNRDEGTAQSGQGRLKKSRYAMYLLDMMSEGTGLTVVSMSSVHYIHSLESCCGEMCCAVIPK